MAGLLLCHPLLLTLLMLYGARDASVLRSRHVANSSRSIARIMGHALSSGGMMCTSTASDRRLQAWYCPSGVLKAGCSKCCLFSTFLIAASASAAGSALRAAGPRVSAAVRYSCKVEHSADEQSLQAYK